MKDAWWHELWRLQQSQGFPDVNGAAATLRLPISDGLVNQVIAAALPPDGRVRQISVRAQENNRFRVGLRLRGPAVLPVIYLNLDVVSQPQLPESPILVLRWGSSGLGFVASQALRFFDALPPGVEMRDDRILVNLRQLAQGYGFGDPFQWLTSLSLTSEPGRTIVSAGAGVPLKPQASR